MIIFWLIFAIAITAIAYKKKSLTSGGALAAAMIGTMICFTSQEIGIVALLLFFISSSAWSRFRKSQKQAVEEQFEKTGQRDAMQVWANGGVGAVFSVIYFASGDISFLYGVIVSFAAANADTWATELGILNTREPISLRTWKRVPKGSSGAISLFGSLCSFIGSAFVVFPCVLWIQQDLSLGQPLFFTCVGFAGAFCDSIIGAFLQAVYLDQNGKESEKRKENAKVRGYNWINNDVVNFVSIFIATSFGVLL